MFRPRLAATMIAAGLLAIVSGQAHAQVPPYTAYGMGLRAGDAVAASIEGVECGRATATAAGNWKISIPAEAPCHPSEGTTIRFALNGKEQATTVRWSAGGAPLNPRVGVALGAGATATPTATPTKTPTPKATAMATKTPTPRATATPKPVATPRPRPTVPAWPWLARPSR